MEHLESPLIAGQLRESEGNPHGENLILDLAMHRLISFPTELLENSLPIIRKLAELGLSYAKNPGRRYLRCNFCVLIIPEAELIQLFNRGNEENAVLEILERQSRFSCKIGAAGSKNVPMGRKIELNLRYEAHRLCSLLQKVDWQHVGPFSLARSGFYYTGNEDNVRCAFCNLEVRGWEAEDTPEGEHRRWNPDCPFLRNKRGVGNVDVGRELEQECQLSRNNPFAVPQGLGKYGPHLRVVSSIAAYLLTPQDLSIQELAPPLHPQFRTLASRIGSFNDFWPRGHKQTPRGLAKIGFFYTGAGDRVICFYCNLGLKDWDPNDDPFVQHCKWNSNCQYLRVCSGPDSVERVLLGKRFPDSPVSSGRGNGELKCLKCSFSNVSKVNLPCGHLAFCTACSQPSCTICEEEIIAEIIVPGLSFDE